MSYKDDDSILFPTRFGPPIGTARERTMIDNCGGAFGIVRRVRENPDGSSTLLRTRAGNPDFMTDNSGAAKICWQPGADLDSGFVDTDYNVNGIGDSTSGPLISVVDRTGTPMADVKIKDTHAWKETFFTGVDKSTTTGDSVLYSGLPSNYSGLMRRLMQVQHGSSTVKKKVPYEVPAGTECPTFSTPDPFSCRYVKTHGLFIGSTGKRWVIEVSSEGVFRIPIDFVAEFTTDDVPTFEQGRMAALADQVLFEAEMRDYWTITKFKHGDKEKIADAPESYAEDYSPWYPWCGWAFDYKGRKAVIALSRQHPMEPTWFQAALYDITIAEAEDGSPTYVTCSKSEESDLMSPYNDTTANSVAAFQIPAGLPGYCATQSLFSVVGHSGQIHAPMFAFYDGGGRQVFYFDTYASSTKLQSYDNRSELSVHCPRAGSWMRTTAQYGTNPSDLYIGGIDWGGLWVGCEGDTSGSQNGGWGGWYGFSGANFPAQNEDFIGTKTVTRDYKLGPSGWSGYLGAGAPRCSMVPAYTDVNGSLRNERWEDYWWGSCSNDTVRFQATAVVRYSESGSHSLIKKHYSTLVLNGYDRESVCLYVSKRHYEASYTVSGWFRGNDSYIQLNTTAPLFSRVASGTVFSNECGPYYGGATDWCSYADPGGGQPFIPSTIKGWIDYTPVNGIYENEGNNLWTSMDSTTLVDYSGSETYPERDTWDRKVYLRLGDENVVRDFSDYNVHDTYLGMDIFSSKQGMSAFSSAGARRYFYQTDINTKPFVVNLGTYAVCLRSLYGFIGVF